MAIGVNLGSRFDILNDNLGENHGANNQGINVEIHNQKLDMRIAASGNDMLNIGKTQNQTKGKSKECGKLINKGKGVLVGGGFKVSRPVLQPINSNKGSGMGLGQNPFDDASKMSPL